MENLSSSSAVQKAAWGWVLLNVLILVAAAAADLAGMQAAQSARSTFHTLAFVTKLWILGLFVAALWLGAFVAFRRASASVPRWAFGLIALLTGLLVLGTFPPLMQPLWSIAPLRPIWRFELHAGPAHFAGLTLDLLFLLNLWGVLNKG